MEKKEFMGITCLKEKDGQLKVKLAVKLKELEEYANNLLNLENKWDVKLINAHVEGPYERFVEEDVQNALSSMKIGKATGPSDITFDMLKPRGKESVGEMLKVANGLLEGEKMPGSWKLSDLIPIYKGKGDMKLCGSYRSIKLLEHSIKVVEKCLRRDSEVQLI